MRTSPHLGLRIWNLLLDAYDPGQLADNWAKVDAHDHSPGRGVLIPTEGIAFEAISFPLVAVSVFPKVTAVGGELKLEHAEEKILAGGPTLEVPETGIYEIGLQLTGSGLAACELEGKIAVNGTAEYTLFDFVISGAGSTTTTNFVRHELKVKDALTVKCASGNTAKVTFKNGRLSIWRVG